MRGRVTFIANAMTSMTADDTDVFGNFFSALSTAADAPEAECHATRTSCRPRGNATWAHSSTNRQGPLYKLVSQAQADLSLDAPHT